QQSIKVVYYVTEGTPLGCQARSELIATGVHLAGKTFGTNLYQIQGLGFRFPEPAYAERLEQFFGIKPLFNQPQNWISFHSKFIDKPLIQANMELFSRLRNEAETAVSRFNNMHEFSSKVMHILFQWPDSVPITKESVAELLSTSSRTLTRRLQEEGCQFSTLLRDVRLEKAKLALENGYNDVQQLAIDLGFSDRRGFERAFKQWTGKTPASYRKEFQQDTVQESALNN
ncbi:MAG: helix-turn-helix domain-containing protein, partial [Venatoribacter sp.]